MTEKGECIKGKKVILATGLKEIHPAIENIMDFYGKSLFSCPYCDGWELKDHPLMIISESHSVSPNYKKTSVPSGTHHK
ncbi:hypothetical protein M3183_26620 [Neobacillus mesonae]|nr:hypothetical protein [Neobacillus mesonae]